MSDSEHFTVSYTSISSNSDPSAWGIPLMDVGEVLEMDPYEEVAQQGQAAPPSLTYVPDPIELEHHVPVYVPEPMYPEYLVPSDDDIPVEDPKEDLIDYAADADDDEDKKEESFEDDDDEEEEYLAPADSTAIASPAVDRVVARLLALPTPPPSPLTSLSSPLPHIPSPSLPLPSPPTYTSPTYSEAPLGYREARIRLRAKSPLPSPTSPPTHHPLPLPALSTSRGLDIPEADIPPRKRLLLTAPTRRFKVWESFATAATRQLGSIVAHRVDYSFVDTMDASIRASKRRSMAAIEMVNLGVSYQANVHRRESKEFYTRHQDAQRGHAVICDEVDTLRRYLSSMCTTHEQERVEARQALDRSEAHNRALEARIIVLETQAYSHEWQR
ncbi:hypothetical protein Tco_0739366 [Tanacetum coccineum]